MTQTRELQMTQTQKLQMAQTQELQMTQTEMADWMSGVMSCCRCMGRQSKKMSLGKMDDSAAAAHTRVYSCSYGLRQSPALLCGKDGIACPVTIRQVRP